MGCSRCGASSTAEIGFTVRTCIGEGSRWNIKNNQCLCGKYYKPISKLRSEDSDSFDNFKDIENLVCPIGEAFNEVTQSCVSENELKDFNAL